MDLNASTIPASCPECGHKHIVYKTKAGLWECEDCEVRFPGSSPGQPIGGLAAEPKDVFFSYGHDDNAELVRQFRTDLEKRGHRIWFDEKDIGTWDDWKGTITRGIDHSEMAVAFMTAHSIRMPHGVCQNEIAIAMNRFGTVYPVVLEAGIAADIPVTVRHLQWPDLSDWKAIRAGNVQGIEWNRWYEEKLLSVVEKIEGEATNFANETGTLRRALQPTSFESRIAQHVPGFVGREWVFDAYEQWLDQQRESRLFWIKGGPGMGKSAIAANLAHTRRSAIVASWFCDARSRELNDPALFIRSIAFQMALRWEDFRVRLLRKLDLNADAPDERCAQVRADLAQTNPHDLFRLVLAEPIAGLIWREHKLVVVIDGLDEAVDRDGDNPIACLIGSELVTLQDWIGFVVTSRPEDTVTQYLNGFKRFEFDAQDPRNLEDLRAFFRSELAERSVIRNLPETEHQRVEDLLVERSGGMILYLRMVDEGLREGSLSLSQLEHLEAGLPGLYRRYYDSFQHRFGPELDNYVEQMLPILGLVLAAPGPMPSDMARTILGWNISRWTIAREKLGAYLSESAHGIKIYHQSLADWLTSPGNRFIADPRESEMVLAAFLWRAFEAPSDAPWQSRVVDWLPLLMPLLPQWNDALVLDRYSAFLIAQPAYPQAVMIGRRKVELLVGTGGLAVAHARLSLAALLMETGDASSAALELAHAAQTFDAAGSPAEQADCRCMLSAAQLGAGCVHEARQSATEGLEIVGRHGLEVSLSYGKLLIARGTTAQVSGNLDDALNDFEIAIDTLSEQDQQWGPYLSRAIFGAFFSVLAKSTQGVGPAQSRLHADYREDLDHYSGYLKAIYEARLLATEIPARGEAPYSPRTRAATRNDLAMANIAISIAAKAGTDRLALLPEAKSQLAEAGQLLQSQVGEADLRSRILWISGVVAMLQSDREAAHMALNAARENLLDIRGPDHVETRLVERLLDLCAQVEITRLVHDEPVMRDVLIHGWVNVEADFFSKPKRFRRELRL